MGGICEHMGGGRQEVSEALYSPVRVTLLLPDFVCLFLIALFFRAVLDSQKN